MRSSLSIRSKVVFPALSKLESLFSRIPKEQDFGILLVKAEGAKDVLEEIEDEHGSV